jgi:hypothetical protein
MAKTTMNPRGFLLADDGTLDTVLVDANGTVYRFSQEFAADYRDPETGALDFYEFVTAVEDM